MGFFRQEYKSGLPFLSPGDLRDPGIEPGSPLLQADSLSAECGNLLGIGDNADCQWVWGQAGCSAFLMSTWMKPK